MMLGWFSIDPLEKAFGKLRQGSGGTYFIMAQAVTEKVNIDHAKLFLQLGVNLSQDSSAQNDGHRCDTCSRLLNDKECEVFDNLHALEASVKEETLLSLIYIAGYVQKKGWCGERK